MANDPIPVLQRKVAPEGPNVRVPDFQASTDRLASTEGNLGAIGASVAQSASNAMATQLGYEKGKTPNGDLAPPLTDFDKNFNESYQQQAHATLSLQGQQLLDTAHITMGKANSLTPDLISKTTDELQKGLNQIAEQAPTAVKSDLQKQFNSNLLNSTTQWNEKMTSQQREGQKNTLLDGIDVGIKNALEFGKNGDLNGVNTATASAKSMADNALANGFINKETARTIKETADQTAFNGLYINMAMKALNQGTYAQFEKNFADNKPEGMTNEQWLATGEAFKKQVSFIQGMQEQDQNLKSQQMVNKIAADPGAITGTEWQEFESQVNPLKAEEVKFKYIQALKHQRGQSNDVDTLVGNFSNPRVWANTSAKTQNEAFNKSVDYAKQQAQNNGTQLSDEDAQVQVAASAGGEVKVFTNQLKNELHSSNPAFIESAANKIHLLEAMDAGHALDGLSDQDKALYTSYEALRDSRDPTTAARDATDTVLNQDPEVQRAVKEKWSSMISASTQGGVSHTKFALSKFGMSEGDFINPSTAQVYGSDVLQKYSTFYQLLKGDDNSAQKLTQKYIDDNYGTTGVNGGNYKTFRPIEKMVGFKNSDGVPYIQRDMADQITQKFGDIKKLFDSKKSNEYWEVNPVSGNKHGIFSTTYDPVSVTRTMKTPEGLKKDSFNVVLQGNAFDSYDVAIQTETGMRNLYQIAPYLGVVSYRPNVQSIKSNYTKDHPLK